MAGRRLLSFTPAELQATGWLHGEAETHVPPADWLHIAESLRLTPRELQIVVGVYNDEKNLAIALRLGISQHTVRSHFRRLHAKLGVSSRSAIMARLIEAILDYDRGSIDSLS